MATNEELIRQMYDSSFASKKAQLQQDYETADSELSAAKEKNAKVTDQNLTRTAVEGQKAAMNMAEYHNANGLSSGARAQARLSLENQTQADMTTLRAAQQEADAEIERQRALLAQDYSAAIAQAQAENDLQLAQALYEKAQQAEAQLLAKQEAAAGIMAGVGDFSAYKTLYGMTDAQIAQLSDAYKQSAEAAALEAEKAEWDRLWKIAYDIGDKDLMNALLVAAGLKEEDPTEPTEPVTDDDDTGATGSSGSALFEAAARYADPFGVSRPTGTGLTNKMMLNYLDNTGIQGTSPNFNPDGTVTVGGKKMTVDELAEKIRSGEIIEEVDAATGTHTYRWYRISNGGR